MPAAVVRLDGVELRPSGEQHEIAFADQRAMVTEVGATLREYSVAGRQVIEGFGPGEVCSGGRGQVLVPWPNRVRDGSYEFGGTRHQLAQSEPERHNAIHGLVRWVPWRLLDRAPDRVQLGFTIHPQPGYPFTVVLSIRYALAEAGLRVSLLARNRGEAAAPFGAGQHPYLRPAGGSIDGAQLRVPARSHIELDQRLIPTGRLLSVSGGPLDYREQRPVDATALDTCFTDFSEPYVELDGTRLWWDALHHYVQLFSGDTLDPGRRRTGLAVEPMSCPPDAFNSGTGLVILAPGGEWSGSWGITPGPI